MFKKMWKKKLELNVLNFFYTLQNYYSERFYQNDKISAMINNKKLIFVLIYILFLILSH